MKLIDVKYAKFLLIFYLLISGNYIDTLFGCDIQNVLRNNRYIKHFLGFASLYLFVMLDKMNTNSPLQSLKIASAMYGWFVLSTRSDYRYLILSIAVIFGILIVSEIAEYYKKDEEREKELHKTLKDTIYHIDEHQRKYFTLSFIITLIGAFVYLGKRGFEYGREWSWEKFFVGVKQCKFNQEGTMKTKTDLQYIMKSLQMIYKSVV